MFPSLQRTSHHYVEHTCVLQELEAVVVGHVTQQASLKELAGVHNWCSWSTYLLATMLNCSTLTRDQVVQSLGSKVLQHLPPLLLAISKCCSPSEHMATTLIRTVGARICM